MPNSLYELITGKRQQQPGQMPGWESGGTPTFGGQGQSFSGPGNATDTANWMPPVGGAGGALMGGQPPAPLPGDQTKAPQMQRNTMYQMMGSPGGKGGAMAGGGG